MRDVHRRFAAWISDSEISQADVAKRVGCSQVFISMLERGERSAGLRFATAIERVTADWDKGPIRAVEWLPDAAEASP